ncbi:MAG: thioesterase family protein [Acidimicrobiia bacterium]|nr:thioesterase family protein [Acidimicrobiia bacterium]
MDAQQWLGLRPTHNPMRWYLPVTEGICSGLGSLFGGCGLGAAIEVMERVTGRPVVWATAQYLNYTTPPSVLDLDLHIGATGRTTTQATVTGHVGDTGILVVNGALGRRDLPEEGQWVTAPVVPPPGECPPRQLRFDPGNSISTRLEQRVVAEEPGTGRTAFWTRMPELLENSAASLAVLGDFVPMGLGHAVTSEINSNSLDNTLRVVRIVPTEWVLVDIRIEAVANGFGHGHIYLWSDDGVLMGTASQSAMIRPWKGS